MKSGDYIKTSNALWTVAYIGEPQALCPALRPGRYAFIVRDLPNDYFDDVAYSYVHEDDVYLGWQQGPQFQLGQFVIFEDELYTLYRITDHLASLRARDGSFVACFKWQLALLVARGKRLSFEHADWIGIPAEAV